MPDSDKYNITCDKNVIFYMKKTSTVAEVFFCLFNFVISHS